MFSQGASGGDDQDNDNDLSECPGDDYIQHRVRACFITFILATRSVCKGGGGCV